MKNLRVGFSKGVSVREFKMFWLVIVLMCFTKIGYSQSYTVIGCVSDDTGYLYTGPAGMNSPRSGGYGPVYETIPVVTSGQIGTGIYCSPVVIGNCVIRTKSKCTKCTGPYDYQPGWGSDYWYEQAGKLKGFMNCPLDDYVGFIMVLAGGIGFVMIRRNFLFN